jgi:hypothetical protein
MVKDCSIQNYIEHVIDNYHPENLDELTEWVLNHIRDTNPKSKFLGSDKTSSVQRECRAAWVDFHDSQLNHC